MLIQNEENVEEEEPLKFHLHGNLFIKHQCEYGNHSNDKFRNDQRANIQLN